VNGKIVPLRYKLRNGDQVEVLTSPQAHPSKDWLTFAKTSRAQQRIRAFIKLQQREKSLILGRELTDREFKRFGLNLNKIMKSGEMKPHAETYGFRSEEDLLVAVGYGKIQPGQLVDAMVPKEKVEEVREKEKQPSEPGSPSVLQTVTNFAKKVVGRKSSGGVLIGGIDDVLERFGRCCNPVPGDAIVGFITRGRGVTVHTAACTKAMATDPERKVDVAWDVKGDFRRPVSLRVLTADRPGLLAEMSQIFSKKGVNISQANCRATSDQRAVNTFEVTITDLKQLTDLMRSIEKLPGVHSVERV
jgi:GTP pyrophosphokinase